MNSIYELQTSGERAFAEGFVKSRLRALGVSREMIEQVWRHGIEAAEDDEQMQRVR